MSHYTYKETAKRTNGKVIKVSTPEEARMLLQSYVLTTAKYDFSVYEKRILFYFVKEAQQHLCGLKLDSNVNIHTIIGTPAQQITMPIAAVLLGEDDKNHARIKDAAIALTKKTIVYEDKKIWTAFSMVSGATIKKDQDTITFNVNPVLWQCILDFSKGFHPYELQAAMKFKSVYSMRFYEYVSNPKRGFEPIVYIDTIKGWFGLENQYATNKDFIKRVVKAAQKDLDANAPWSFDFEPIKEGRKYTKLKITPRPCPNNGDAVLQKEVARRRTDLSWYINDHALRKYLHEVIGFSDTELFNNIDYWEKADDGLIPDLYEFIQLKYADARHLEKKGNLRTTIKGYVTGCVQRAVEAAEKIKQPSLFEDTVNDIASSFNFK